MSALAAPPDSEKTEWTEEEFLAGVGLDPNIRYEYVRGQVYAKATPSGTHAEISSNLFVPLFQLLRGKPCKAFIGNMSVRINFLGKPAFYVPDIMVACDDKPLSANFREEPILLVEVTSPSTVTLDTREKLLIYTALPSLRHYLIVSSKKTEVVHYSRTETRGWTDSTLTKPEELITIPELDFVLTVGQLYEHSGLSAA